MQLCVVQCTTSNFVMRAPESYISTCSCPPTLNQLNWLSQHFPRPLYPISFNPDRNSEKLPKLVCANDRLFWAIAASVTDMRLLKWVKEEFKQGTDILDIFLHHKEHIFSWKNEKAPFLCRCDLIMSLAKTHLEKHLSLIFLFCFVLWNIVTMGDGGLCVQKLIMTSLSGVYYSASSH